MSNQTTHNHYNAKSYLKGFKSLGKIYRYEIATKLVIPIRSLDRIGVEKNIYSLELEKFFANNIDSKYPQAKSNIIRAMKHLNDQLPISPDDLMVIISFIAYQVLRHPVTITEYFKRINEYRNKLPSEEKALLDLMYSPQQSYEKISYEVYLKTFKILKQKRWGIHKAPKGYTLITNDTAIGMVTSDTTFNPLGLGFSSPKTLVFFVMDKKHCLVMDDGKPGLSNGIVARELSLDGYNTVLGAMVLDAKKYTYSPSLRSHQISLQARDSTIEYTNRKITHTLK